MSNYEGDKGGVTMTDDLFTCAKCAKEQDRSEVFAWDGFDREACVKCFRTWGWRSFGENFTGPHP